MMHNYLLFISVCRDMFFMLTIAAIPLFGPYWGSGPLLMGFGGGPLSLIQEDLHAWKWVLLMLATWIFGLIIIYCTDKLHRFILFVVNDPHYDLIERTLWLQELPTSDQLSGEHFHLTDTEFKSVKMICTLS